MNNRPLPDSAPADAPSGLAGSKQPNVNPVSCPCPCCAGGPVVGGFLHAADDCPLGGIGQSNPPTTEERETFWADRFDARHLLGTARENPLYTEAWCAQRLDAQEAAAQAGVAGAEPAQTFVDVPGVGKREAIVRWPRDWHTAWNDGQGRVYVDGVLLGSLSAEETLLQAARESALRSDLDELREGLGVRCDEGGLAGTVLEMECRATVQRGREPVAGEVPPALKAHVGKLDSDEMQGRFIGLLFAARRLAEESIYRGFGGRMECERCNMVLVNHSGATPVPHKKHCPVQNVLDRIAHVIALLGDGDALAPEKVEPAAPSEISADIFARPGKRKVCRKCGVGDGFGWSSAQATGASEDAVFSSLGLNQLIERPVGTWACVLWTHNCEGAKEESRPISNFMGIAGDQSRNGGAR